ncbi:MAG: GNAT family N-acetyltransferase [Myxococcota bacterium]|nr:GNAT family N-acetyltransferase [Myxococcota bacterium]
MPALDVPPTRRDGLLLRPYARGDLDLLTSLVTRDDVMARVGGALRVDEVAGLLERYLMPDDPRVLCALAVFDGSSGAYVGTALLTRCREVDGDAPELGFAVHPDHQGRGHATAIARALIDIAREHTGAARVYATVDEDHAASIRVLEKAGLARERVCRDADGDYLLFRA